MNSASIKAKGREAENRVVEYLKAHGEPGAERRRQAGVNDRGDISGVRYTVLEVKDEAGFKLAGWLKELAVEMANDGAMTGAVIHKRRGTLDVGEWYVTLPMKVYVPLLRAALSWADEYGPLTESNSSKTLRHLFQERADAELASIKQKVGAQ